MTPPPLLLYLDCTAGASGDMVLAGFLDMGLPLVFLQKIIRQLGFSQVAIIPKRISRNGIPALSVTIRSERKARSIPKRVGGLIDLVSGSQLVSPIKNSLIRVLTTLGRAEGKIHGRPWRTVILHQLAEVDTLVSCVGFCAGLNYFKVKKVYVSWIPLGRRHQDHAGRWRATPGPATCHLLDGFSLYHRPERFEWTTPTAAALLSALATPEPAPPFHVQAIGHSAGTLRTPGQAGLLRLFLGIPIRQHLYLTGV